MFSAEKPRDDEVTTQEKSRTLPDISAATPKVSLFKFQGMGKELIDACIKQTEEFTGIAGQKVTFMGQNAQAGVFQCVIRNATGVRLSLVDEGLVQGGDYPPPSTIEPGECASFLTPAQGASGESGTPFTYEVEVFEGPVATPNLVGGWTAPTGELKISQFRFQSGTLGQRTGFVNPSTATARVQVEARGDLAASTLTWKIILIVPRTLGARAGRSHSTLSPSRSASSAEADEVAATGPRQGKHPLPVSWFSGVCVRPKFGRM